MEWLNYHHLLYFWTVVREGGISKAAQKLRLSQPTISAQIHQLEGVLGQRLFQRQGRTLVPTDVGRLVFRYADDIFSIGQELMETLRGRPAGRPLQLTVGIANAVPKLIVYRLLRPALRGPEAVQLMCREGSPDQLLAELATHALDVVISDAPAPEHVRVKAFNHLLGESDTAFFAPAALATRLRRRFPASLRDAPALLPARNTALRRGIDEWFAKEDLQPRVIAEFEDTALMKVFSQAVPAVFPAPAVIENDICRFHGVRVVGRTSAVRERYYAISVERRLKHPAVVAITNTAREDVFK
ncbi:MAG TPA: transcriptional activator NhaR [Vicinamibacterales bacterium]|jgi:LysR family transcriptional activator of nhaA|nr:transcriptional activator NhaR [Vicinamibacterales bacterium]